MMLKQIDFGHFYKASLLKRIVTHNNDTYRV